MDSKEAAMDLEVPSQHAYPNPGQVHLSSVEVSDLGSTRDIQTGREERGVRP